MDHLSDGSGEALPTGTVTFLFTDIEGSTALAHSFPGQMPALMERHNAILHQSIQAFHGYVFQIIGDAFCAAFPTAENALNAALAAQRSLQHETWNPAPILVRMGIHTGAAQVSLNEDHSWDYRGYLTLACTQSIMSSAHGGQVLLSNASAELVRGQLPARITLLDMGEHLLKGGMNPERLWQLASDDLLAEFPPLKTLSVLPNNLPMQRNRFVGREAELRQTKDLLAKTCLLTLIGPGGTGKTRLTLQLAADLLPEYAGGTWLVELAPLTDPALVLPTVAEALGLRQIPGVDIYDQVAGFLCAKSLLLILDNCEHLVESCAQLADQLLRHCANLKIIASSREALGIPGEIIYRVPPLGLPQPHTTSLEALRHSEAVQLFVDRATAVKSSFILSEHNAGAVAQICRRLDGIPLALELAAARVAMLTPEQIATRLDDRFQLLTGGSRTALPRQQTLRSLIDWSYDLLSEPERLLFCQLSVFVGGWSLEAAEAVCPDMDVLDLLAQLIQKSLVVAEERQDPATTRFRLLETIRQYARDKLLESGAAVQARDRHLDYYLKFAEAGESNAYGPHQLEWLDRCEPEFDNFRAALQWGLDHNIEAALRLGGALPVFWTSRGFTEGRRWLQAALERAAALPAPPGEAGRSRQVAQAKVLIGLGQLSYADGDYQSGLEASKQAVALYRQLGDAFGLGFALGSLGNMAAFQGDLDLGESTLIEAIRVAREHGNKLVLAYATGVMGRSVYLPRGNLSQARTFAEESIRYSREIGFPWSAALGELLLARIDASLGQVSAARAHAQSALAVAQELRDQGLMYLAIYHLGDVELYADNLLEAQQHHRRAIVSCQELGQFALVAHELESFAYLAQALNQPIRAARLLGAAEAVQESIGTSAVGVERLPDLYERALTWLHTRLDDATYDTHWSEGRDMMMDQAISYALE